VEDGGEVDDLASGVGWDEGDLVVEVHISGVAE
jgi:hypothetical protein